MATKGKRWTGADARVVVDELEASGLSTVASCRRRGLSYERVRKWRARLRREEAVERPRLVELVPHGVQPAGRLAVHCPSGRRIELGDVDLAVGLRLLLAVITERGPC